MKFIIPIFNLQQLKQNANKFLDILQPSIIWNAAINLWYDRIREPEGEVLFFNYLFSYK